MRISIRKKGTGAIIRQRNGRYRANAPRVNGEAPFLGTFDTTREAERAIDAYLAAQEKQS